MGYLGLHQWNFDIRDGELIAENQVVFTTIADALGSSFVTESCVESDRLITAAYRKIG